MTKEMVGWQEGWTYYSQRRLASKCLSSRYYFLKGYVQILHFFFMELPCVGRCGAVAFGVEKCDRIFFLNSQVLCGRVGAIWTSEEAALGELLFVSLPRLLR